MLIRYLTYKTLSVLKPCYCTRWFASNGYPGEGHTPFYYIDTSVLLENIPLVTFIKTTSGTRVVYFP